jgi:hypothetical protein
MEYKLTWRFFTQAPFGSKKWDGVDALEHNSTKCMSILIPNEFPRIWKVELIMIKPNPCCENKFLF